MLQTAAQLQIFGQAQLLTGGGPGGASRTMVLFMFESAFGRWELGYATAAAEMLFLLIVADHAHPICGDHARIGGRAWPLSRAAPAGRR